MTGSNIGELLERLWQDYRQINPQAGAISRLLADEGETVANDHIALRTYGAARVDIDVIARPFVEAGYRNGGQYAFTAKKLVARHYEHPDGTLPKVFISALQLAQCSPGLRDIVAGLLEQVGDQTLKRPDLPVIGRPWKLSIGPYQALAAESEYAAWVAAFGFRANHFTLLVNALQRLSSLETLNAFLQDKGFALNTSGGEIKGSAKEYLAQSSTLAPKVQVEFSDGTLEIPGCYYEFARRYPLPDGRLFQGFVATSADKIFESTDRR